MTCLNFHYKLTLMTTFRCVYYHFNTAGHCSGELLEDCQSGEEERETEEQEGADQGMEDPRQGGGG